jgi:hypothetical protein
MRRRLIWLPGVFGVTAVPDSHDGKDVADGAIPTARIAPRAHRAKMSSAARRRWLALAALLMAVLLAVIAVLA